MSRQWRIRIFQENGSTVEGGFPTQEAAVARQEAWRAVYAASPGLGVTTVLEMDTPARPALEKVRALLAELRAQIGETDPVRRRVQGLEPSTPALAISDALVEAAQPRAQIVYEAEGHL